MINELLYFKEIWLYFYVNFRKFIVCETCENFRKFANGFANDFECIFDNFTKFANSQLAKIFANDIKHKGKLDIYMIQANFKL